MKHGDYELAAKAFKKVIRLYSDHAFAHYCLAKALEAIGGEDEQAKISMDRFSEIVDKDDKWKEYAEHFNIQGVSL